MISKSELPHQLAQLARALAAATTPKAAQRAASRWLPSVQTARSSRVGLDLDSTTETIAIWRRTLVDGERVFVRDATLDDDLFWSAAARIGPKTRRRIVLLGESVARGAYLDPLFNCASALQTYLDAWYGT